MELILLSTPIVVSLLTQGFKQIKRVSLSPIRKKIIRFFAATASFLGVLATAWVSDGEVPVAEIETYATSLVAFIATQVPYILAKLKD